MNFLLLNNGSSSKKYSICRDGEVVYSARFEMASGGFFLRKNGGQPEKIGKTAYDGALEQFFSMEDGEAHFPLREMNAAGVRIVAPGNFFAKHGRIDEAYEEKLRAVLPDSPVHTMEVLEDLSVLKRIAPKARLFGISDSAFHSSMPERAKIYGIPRELAKKHGVYRFGYHGLSVESVLHKAEELFGGNYEKVIVCHLGGGSSVTAVLAGKSVDTSMGFSPLEGLPMSSRAGNLDAGAVLAILEKSAASPSSLRSVLYNESGLLGVSGISGDMRELLTLEKDGNARAHEAVEFFVYGIQKYIGAYFAVLGGLDLLIFTGAMGEGASAVRARICGGLSFLGVSLDDSANDSEGGDRMIGKISSKTGVAVLHSEEERQMVSELTKLMNEKRT